MQANGQSAGCNTWEVHVHAQCEEIELPWGEVSHFLIKPAARSQAAAMRCDQFCHSDSQVSWVTLDAQVGVAWGIYGCASFGHYK